MTSAFLLCALAVAPLQAASGEVALDLRPRRAAKTMASAATAGSSENGLLRSTRLPAGAAKASGLSVGSSLKLSLYDDAEVSLVITRRLEPSLGAEQFLARVAGSDDMLTATVIESPEGLQVSVEDLRRRRVYTVASSRDSVVVRESDPAASPSSCGAAPHSAAARTAKVASKSVARRTMKTASAAARSSAGEAEDGATLIDVLVAYDTGAASWADDNGGGVTNFARQAVAKMNADISNNSLSSLFRFRLVGVVLVNDTTSDLNYALDSVTRGYGAWSVVHAMRETTGADVTSVFVDTGEAYGFNGLANSLQATDPEDMAFFSEYAFSAVSVRGVAVTHTMTHEVGHNMGCGHVDEVQSFEYSMGYRFTGADGVAYHTIMAYNSDGDGNTYVSAPLFSSSDATWAGAAAGDALHDNAKVLRQTYAAVAGFRAQKEPVDPDIPLNVPSALPATSSSEYTATTFEGRLKVALEPSSLNGVVFYTLDGSAPDGETAVEYTKPIFIDRSTLVRFREILADGTSTPEVQALYLERHAVRPGEWTSDVAGVRAAAQRDGRLVCVVLVTNDIFSVELEKVANSAAFTDWAATNGVYLAVADSSSCTERLPATAWFWDLCDAWRSYRYAQFTQMFFVSPSDFSYPIAEGLGTALYGIDNQVYAGYIGSEVYAGTAESLAAGISSILEYFGYDVVPFAEAPVAKVFGTEGMVWSNSQEVPWRSESVATMRAGGLGGTNNYESVLTATVSGKGRLSFDYECRSYSYINSFVFTAGGNTVLSRAYSPHSGTQFSGSVAANVTSASGTTFKWKYTIRDGPYDHGQKYIGSDAGAWVSNVRWIPESELPVVRTGPSGEAAEIPSSWFRQKGLVASGAGLADCEVAADADSDGDGVPNWAEYITGTDPLLKSDAPHCTIEMVDGKPIVEYANEDTLREGYQAVIRGKRELADPEWRLQNGAHRFFRAFIETE